MNVPIEWLKEYVDLPESLDELTSCLTMIGHMLDKSWEDEGQRVIDLELRGNRADLFGLYGIAREISAAYDTTLSPLKVHKLPQVDTKSPLIKANNPEILKRFSGLTLKVKPQASPDFMVKRLKQYGIGSINNIVDITNYVMIETGMPLHAFDAAQIFGKQITVRLAKTHEHIVTFAGDLIELTPKDIVLADTKSILAIPLIGSKMSGCTDATREILLEAAVYNQAMVRQSSRRLSLRTEASLRLEKNISPDETMFALARAVNLLIEFAGAEITSDLSDYYPNPHHDLTIPYSLETTKLITGVDISLEEHCAILESLGCRIKNIKKITMDVTPPAFRTDLTQEADLVEEVIRVFGYDHIPSKLIDGILPGPQTPPEILLVDQIKTILTNLQCNEVISSIFISSKLAELYKMQKDDQAVFVTNPPDPNLAMLTQSLVPNLVDVAQTMLNDRVERIALFETGTTFFKKQKIYQEIPTLALIVAGTNDKETFNKKTQLLNFYDLSGIISALFIKLGMEIEIRPTEKRLTYLDATQTGEIFLTVKSGKQVKLGDLGLLSQSILSHYDTTLPIYVAEINISLLAEAKLTEQKTYIIANKYPPIIEDFSFKVSEKLELADLIKTIKSIDACVAEVKVVDIFEDKRALRVTFLSPDKTLSSAEILPIRQRIIETARKKHGAIIPEIS